MRSVSTWAGAWLLAAVLAAGSALAQDAAAEAGDATAEAPAGTSGAEISSPQVRGAKQGIGIALSDDGRSRLHLTLDVGAGFDTNPYSVPFEDATGFAGDIVTRVRPGIDITYPGSLIAFDAGLFVDYGFLPGLSGAPPEFLLFQSAAEAGLEVNRGGMFSFALGDKFNFSRDPGVVTLGSEFTRLNNALNAGIGFRPGGGTLSFKLGYTFGFEKWFDFFDDAGPLVQAGALDQMAHYGTLRADWRFLPRTGAFLQLQGGVHMYPFNGTNPTSFPIGVLLGVMGQFTPKISGLASIGYQNPLVYDTDTAGNLGIQTAAIIGAVGQAEIRWAIGPTTQLAGGFKREIQPTPLYQYAENNRFYLAFNQAIGAKFVLGLNSGFSILQFGTEQPFGGQNLTTVPGGGNRLDTHLDVRADLAYYMFDWLSFGIVNDLDWRYSNAESSDTFGGGGGVNLSFLSNETLLLASLHY